MHPRRRSPSARAARRLLAAGAPLIVLWAACAHAQSSGAPAASADGMEPDSLYMDADVVTYDDNAKIATAHGQVEVRYGGRTLRAEDVSYDEDKGVVTATGKVEIINADGSAEFAEKMVLDDKMRTGVAIGFAARLQMNIKMAATTAIRRNPDVQELNRAIYTPCPICLNDHPVTPTWSIKADEIVQDKKRRLIRYRNAVIRVFGAPVFYTPVFWHADPSADRASGFLTPKLAFSDRRGLSYEQPYLIVTSPSSDLTVSPQFNSKVNPFLNVDFRKRFYSGEIDVRAGYTYEKDFNGDGDRFGDRTSRSYILARGAFAPSEHWRWGFTAERVSDYLLFDRYEIDNVYETRGPYVADDRRLISQVYAVRQDDNSYVSAAAMSIQGLRPGDNNATFPTIAPLVEGHYQMPSEFAGGRLRLNASAVVLQRDESPLSTAQARIPGLDSSRLTLDADWRTTWTSSAGLRIAPFLNARLDTYRLGDLPPSARASKTQSRAAGVAGADISWPLFRRFSSGIIVIEPLVQVAASPNVKQIVVDRTATGAPVYLDEDSLAFEFDETNLFRANRFPGYDLYDDGLRVNTGVRSSVLWDDGRRAELLLGRSFRDKLNPAFTPQSGLRGKSSDWIVAADAEPTQGLTFFTRARLDSDDLGVRRAEAGVNVARRWGSGYVRYLRDSADINGNAQENLDAGGEVFVTKHWGISVYGNRDLIQNAWVIRDLGLVYKDDCIRFDIIYRREDTVLGRLGPSNSVNVRLTLATLGGPVYGR